MCDETGSDKTPKVTTTRNIQEGADENPIVNSQSN